MDDFRWRSTRLRRPPYSSSSSRAFSVIARTLPAVCPLIVVATFLFSAVKSIPQYEFISSFRKTEAVEYNSTKILKDSLFRNRG